MRLFAAVLIVCAPVAAFAADPAPADAPKPEAPAAVTPASDAKPAASADAKKPAKSGGSDALKSDDQKTLYTLGYYLGSKLAPFSLSAGELKTVQMGLSDSVLGKKPQADISVYGPKINDLAAAREAKRSAGRKSKEKAAIEKLSSEPGFKKYDSGLIMKMETEGTGPQPTADDTVKCHYEGKLVDGTVFDSSYKRGEPASFPLKGVVKCWTEGVAKMKVGGKATLICPSDIAYGDEGRPPTIPGGATLIFTVELLDIVKK